MKTHRKHLRAFLSSEEGPTTTEYGVMLALICVGVIAVMSAFGTRVENIYTILAGTMPNASSS